MVRAMDKDQAGSGDETHFGFKTVREEEKAGLVRSVFESVASRYDVMNDFMSGGVHRIWKDIMVTWADPRPGYQVLDVAGGTGDIAFRMLEHMEKHSSRSGAPMGKVFVADINEEMLIYGRKRADKRWREALPVPEMWLCGDAQTLPVPDASMDLYTIAFGIRNVTRIADALVEARRVLKTGGRFVCLEFSTVETPLLDQLYDAFSFHVIPRIGSMVAGDRESYQYLVESIRRFPDQKTFANMIETAGFSQVKVRPLAGGIAALHSGWKI
jgi:demethylmenaquinone methyltransferase/2-methoxy-6-polyprenyl-1,4-benzoquinol methylase